MVLEGTKKEGQCQPIPLFSFFLFCSGNDFGEHGRILGCNLGEHFSVELDVRLLDGTDELAVGGTVEPGGGIQANRPESSHVALLESTVAVSIDTRFQKGDASRAQFDATVTLVSFGFFQQATTLFQVELSSFDT